MKFCEEGDLPPRMWKKSTKCATSNCVEVAFDVDDVLIRDSKYAAAGSGTASPVLSIPKDDWHRFTTHLLDGRGRHESFPIIVDSDSTGARLQQGSSTLEFDKFEWFALLQGIESGEFSLEVNA